MRKTTWLRGAFLLFMICAFGCANTESGDNRRNPDETIDINGLSYVSKEVSEGNVFGRESEGLSENPLSKPSDELLGPKGVYENLTYTIDPVDVTTYINEVVEFTVELGEDTELVGSDPRFVVVLERGAEANGVLIVDKEYRIDDAPATETTAVVTPDSKDTIKFKVLTGSAYNKETPMYWVNVWAADAEEPQSASIIVKKPPQKGDPEYKEGTKDIENDLTPPPGLEEAMGKTKLAQATIVNLDDLEQYLFPDMQKKLSVKLEGKCSDEGETGKLVDCDVKGEPICWTFVETNEKNKAVVKDPPPDEEAVIDHNPGISTGCGEVDEKGKFTVTIDTKKTYNSRYFLNLFHPKSAPLTYQIETYVMPSTLGEPGDGPGDDLDGDGKPDEGRNVVVPGADKSPLTGEEAVDMLKKQFPDEDDPARKDIEEKCYKPKGAGCTLDSPMPPCEFVCSVEKNEDGTWSVKDESGNDVVDPFREKLSGEDAENFLKEQFPDPDDPTRKSIEQQCYKPENAGCTLDANDPPCEFVCNLEKNADGTWSVKDEEGKDLWIDTDGDGKVDGPIKFGEKITGEEAEEFLGQLWTDPNDPLKRQIEEACFIPKGLGCQLPNKDSSNLAGPVVGPDPENDPSCQFICQLKQEADGTWMIYDKDGNPLMVDVDGDGQKDDPVRVVLVDNGDGTSRFDGFDIDGDGKPDVAPDPCLYLVCPNEEDILYEIKCRYSKGEKPDEDAPFNTCIKASIGLDQNMYIDILLQNKGATDPEDNAGSGKSLDTKIIRGKLASNNAMFEDAFGPDEMTLTTKKGIAQAKFWTGTAYDSLYYISIQNEDAKPVMLPINVINSLDIPTKPGDAPDDSVLEDGGEAVTPPGDMPDYIPDLGDVRISLAPGAEQILSVPVIKTIALNIQVKSVATGKAVTSTQTYWKVTRGKSPNNNGSLSNSKVETDGNGIASGIFYTGTGYDSLYYISVFHPNFVNAEKEPQAFIFAVRTTNDTGTVEGPSGDPSLPEGETKCSAGFVFDKVGKKCVEEGCECEDAKCGNCETGDPSIVNGIEVNPNLPQVTCDECDADPAKCEEKGCLELTVVGNSTRRLEMSKMEELQFKLTYRLGNEISYPKDTIYFTLDKGEGADGMLLSKKGKTNDEGVATAKMKTGSKKTSYRLNGMHPNINDGANMVPVSITIAVTNDPIGGGTDSKTNKITLTADATGAKQSLAATGESIAEVHYYVYSAHVVSCGDEFVYGGTSERNERCGQMLTNFPENPNVCGKIGEKNSPYTATATMGKANDKFTVFAIGTNDAGAPVAVGCVANQAFGPANSCSNAKRRDVCCSEDAKALYNTDDETCMDAKECKCTERNMDVKVPMKGVPLVIADSYQTKSLINIGPLLGEDSEVMQEINKLMGKLNEFIGQDPAEKLTASLTQYVIYLDADGKESRAGEKSCLEQINKMTKNGNDPKCAYDNGSQLSNFESCKALDQNVNMSEEDVKKFKYLTNCDCLCASMYYYTAKNKIGKTIAKLARKGLKSVINKYLGREAIEGTLCGYVDGIQFITLIGETTFRKEGNKLYGSSAYTGAEVPFIEEELDLGGKIVGGTWREGILSTTGTEAAFSDYSLNLTYGEFVLAMVGKMVGGIDESGNVNFAKIMDCSKLPSINLMVTEVSSEFLANICTMGLAVLTKTAATFAVSQSMSLGVKLNGTAEFKRGDSCQQVPGSSGCAAQLVENGIWEGSGSLGKKSSKDINGAWVATTNGTFPAFKYGNKSIEDYMAENSICRKKLKETAETSNEDMDSNKACLLGKYEPIGRLTNNACKNENCQGKDSIIVCTKDGKLNSSYADAGASKIIKDANKQCLGKTSGDCTTNPEIINEGKGITNAECLAVKCQNKACIDNTSIFVCNDDSTMIGDVDNEGEYDLSEVCGDMSTDDCIAMKVREACSGKCDDPACVMNSELASCSSVAIPTTAPKEQLLAEWNFSQYYDSATQRPDNNALKADMLAFKSSVNKNSMVLQLLNSGDPKLVMGSDGMISALSIPGLNGDELSNALHIYSENAGDTHEYTKIKFKVVGDGRIIHYVAYNPSDSTTATGKITTSVGDTWGEFNVVTLPKGMDPVKGFIIYPNAGIADSSSKLLRYDEIQVWGKKK